jgi:rhamnulokinase
LADVDVILPGTHDTASAVMAVPAAGEPREKPNWCYISSGTWLLMGVETLRPVITDECLRLNFTNEGGIDGTNRLLKNITGLWLLQECRRVWQTAGRDYGWDELNRLADAAPRLQTLVNPDDAAFQSPGDMPSAIQEFCRRTGQRCPESDGQVVRTAIESVALKCRWVLEGLERLIGGTIDTMHIVGGGAHNRRLCQATADACGRPVLAGPSEATAIGNLMVQAIASGAVGSIGEARAIIRESFPLTRYEPCDTAEWNDAYQRFLPLAV